MTQQQGSNAKLIFDTEDTFKTTPVSPDAHYFTFVSESLRLSRNLISSRSIRSNRNPLQPTRGNMDIAGDVTFELCPEHGRVLQHVFGSYTAVTGLAGQWYTHTYKIGELPAGMVLEKQFTDLVTDEYFLYNGCKVNSFRLAARTEGPIECTISVIGAKETVGVASFDGTPTDLGFTPFDGFECSITEGGASLGTVTEIDFTLENNLDGNTYVIDGTGQRHSLPAGTVKVTGTIKTLFEDILLYTKAVNNTESSLVITFTKGLGDGTDSNEKLTFYMDEVIYKPQAPVISGPTGVLVELPFEAFYGDDADASALRAILLSPTLAYT